MGGPQGVLPNFLIIGAQKSGSSWLAAMLAQHPDIFVYPHEIHYFDKDYNFEKGLAWYSEHFIAVRNESAIGEKTPDYLWANGKGVEGHLSAVHRNIYDALPHAKLIVILRNPVERAISAVNHIIRSGRISPFHNIDDLLIGDKKHLIEGHGVVEQGMYADLLKAYQQYFDSAQILVLIFEEAVVEHPDRGLREVCEFLSVDPSYPFSKKRGKVNKFNRSKVGLTIEYFFPFFRPIAWQLDRLLPSVKQHPNLLTIQELYKIFLESNEELFGLLGREIAAWR